MGHLRGQRRRHRLEVVRLAAVVDRHLPPLAMPQRIPKALQAVSEELNLRWCGQRMTKSLLGGTQRTESSATHLL